MSTTTAPRLLSRLPRTCPVHGPIAVRWDTAWYGDGIADVQLSCGCTVTDEDPEE